MNSTIEPIQSPQIQKRTYNSPALAKFIKRVKNPFLFRLFTLTKMPLGFFCGVKLVQVNTERVASRMPFRWFNQNPFRSTHFAALAMAGELPTGLLGLMAIEHFGKPVSMLVIDMQAEYFKKAADVTTFVSEDGPAFFKAVEETIATGEARVVDATSIARNKEGVIVAKFKFRWSLKVKSKK